MPHNMGHKIIYDVPIPFKSKWVAPVLWTATKDTPVIPYQTMHEILKPNINKYAMMNNILQQACDVAKLDQFGQPEDNVKYTHAIAKAIEDMGHTVELIFTDRCATMKTNNALVLKEEFNRLKVEKCTIT
jgi:hypothetical protein